MARHGLTLRGFCRAAGLDASFFSKVLSGKRSPPAEEAVLRRIAEVLGLEAAELIVAAGRIPSEWGALWKDPRLFRDVDSLAREGRARAARGRGGLESKQEIPVPGPRRDLAEELL